MYRIEHQYPQSSKSENPESTVTRRRPQHSPDENSETCLVCGSITHGMHFQVASCRACAAFFRRSVKDKKVYKCRRGDRNCDLTNPPNGKPLCKFCRLKKCYAVGMRLEYNVKEADEVQSNLACGASSVDSGADLSFELSGLSITDGNRLNWDVSQIIYDIKELFKSTVRCSDLELSCGLQSTPFQQLQHAVDKFLGEMCPPEPIDTAEACDKLFMYVFMDKYARKMAQMFMSCDPFVHLCYEDKFKLFKFAWMLIWVIERPFSTCELFGYDMGDTRSLVTDTLVINADKTAMFMPGMDPAKLAELTKFCNPMHSDMFDCIIVPMKQIQMSRYELCYVVGLIMFSTTEVRGLSRETKIVGEQLVDQFSTELHNYYTYEKKITNYAPRHSKLIRLISGAQKVAVNFREYMTMAKIFDIFIADFLETELFN